ncbi:MAG: helix-turn-helix transcriptional regulator [Clostridia bacterium]|nr:helix-turn-helix transcriptional regulator [Clostridia bacterium]
MKTANEILAELRADADISQAELGSRLGITQRRISFLETGVTEPNLDDLRAYCRYFNVSSDYILGLVDQPRKLKP